MNAKKQKHDLGFIEKREIISPLDSRGYFKYFLTVVDTLSQKVVSTYGPFESPYLTEEFAKVHSVNLG